MYSIERLKRTMTSRWQSPMYGGNGGTAFGPVTCPDGEYIKTFYGRGGSYVDQVCATCSDGTQLGCYGGGGGDPWSNNQGPYISMYGRGAGYVDNLLGIGGGGGDPWGMTCPTGRVVVGMNGRAARYVDKIGFTCGVDKRTYCVNNLEDPVCNNIDKNILNKACSVQFTQTCRDRKDELNESVVLPYCANNPNDPVCSCYLPAPDYIPKELGGLTKCWSQQCATSGYVPMNMRGDCPNITVCRQDLGVSGEANRLTNNVIVQNCATPATSTTPGTSATPTVPDNQGSPYSIKSISTSVISFVRTYIWIVITVILGICVIIYSMYDTGISERVSERVSESPTNTTTNVIAITDKKE